MSTFVLKIFCVLLKIDFTQFPIARAIVSHSQRENSGAKVMNIFDNRKSFFEEKFLYLQN